MLASPETEPDTATPWFTDVDAGGVRDFWRVYDARFDEIEGAWETRPADLHAILAAAFRTRDWTAYEAVLTRRGEQEARLGHAFDRARDPGVQLVRLLTRHLVRAYAESPPRLIAAFDVMSEFLARRTATQRTARHRASKAALRTSERNLAITLESIGDGVIATDAKGLVVRINRVAQDLSKWSAAEAVGRPLDEVFRVVDEDTGVEVKIRLPRASSVGAAPTLPRRCALVARDGTVRPIADSIAAIRDETGGVHGAVVVFSDQTRERRREQALDASRARTAAMLEASPDGVMVIDASGVVSDFNAAAEVMFGTTRDEIAGHRLQDALIPDAGAAIHGVTREAQTGCVGVLARRTETVARRADGTQFPIDLAIVPIRPDGSFTCFVRDLTEAKASVRALRSLAEWVESSREEERTRIARELHDEIGQQLTALRMDLAWLVPRHRGAGPESLERLTAMTHVVDGMYALVRRIGTELRPGMLDDLGLAAAVEWQASEFERRSGIVVEMDTSAEIGALDRPRSTAIFRIFQELLTNVARHAEASRVAGRLDVEGDLVVLTVSDDGRGIRPTEVTNETSLGLLGIRERTAMHGGTFHIGSDAGGGTTARVALPREGSSGP